MSFDAIEVIRKSGEETFTLKGKATGATLLGFWQWSASDLVNNALRGVLAEFIVASALNCHHGVRTEWDAYDLTTPDGIRVEVKSAAYLQSWKQEKLSAIHFDVRPTKGWDAATNTYSSEAMRQSDVYVFCLLGHKDKASVDPLNLDQWVFFVIRTERLNALLGEQKTLSLSGLLKLEPVEAGYEGIGKAVAEENDKASHQSQS